METPLIETPTIPLKCHPWSPYSDNPDRKTVPEAVNAPKNPIGISALIDPSEPLDPSAPLDPSTKTEDFEPMATGEWNPDLHIVMRAIRQAGLADQVICATRAALELPFYRELVNYRIEFMYHGQPLVHVPCSNQTLGKPSKTQAARLPPATANTEPGAPRQRRAERIQVVIELRDPATMRVEEHQLPVDIAFLNQEIYWPTRDDIMLSTEGNDPTVADLAELITDACFSESDHTDDDSVGTQLEQHRNYAYKTAAGLLLPRNLAVAAVVKRHIKRTFGIFLENGERMEIAARRHHEEIDVTVNTTIPPAETDAAEN